MKYTFKTVAYICGLGVFLITVCGYRQSHSVNNSIEPPHILYSRGWVFTKFLSIIESTHSLRNMASKEKRRGKDRAKLEQGASPKSNVCHIGGMTEDWRGPRRVTFPLYGRRTWQTMGTNGCRHSLGTWRLCK